jgi:hypothetical protein
MYAPLFSLPPERQTSTFVRHLNQTDSRSKVMRVRVGLASLAAALLIVTGEPVSESSATACTAAPVRKQVRLRMNPYIVVQGRVMLCPGQPLSPAPSDPH